MIDIYTFLCQADNRINYDFVLETLNAVDFANWYANETIYKSIMTKDLNSLDIKKGDKSIIPIGSVQFVQSYYREYLGLDNFKPVNIPLQLLDYTERRVWFGDETEIIKQETFCKSSDKIKEFTDIIDSKTTLEKGSYIFSELIDIESEWRCFVLRGELLAIHNYNNTLGTYPNIERIKSMISKYKDLNAYTLDVAIDDHQRTVVIELHDFYSCGLYGFNNHKKLLQMLITSHLQKVNNV